MIAAIIARLTSECPNIATVEQALRLNPMERSDYPVVAVSPLSAAPSMQTMSGSYVIAKRYELLITSDDMDTLDIAQSEIADALSGWRPTGSTVPFSYVGGQAEQINGGMIQWRDVWSLGTCL